MSVVITSGEPAGIGPDIIIKAVASQAIDGVVLGDIDVIRQRARQLNIPLSIFPFEGQAIVPKQGHCYVYHHPVAAKVVPGVLDERNARHVLSLLDTAIDLTHHGSFTAMVTAPLQKEVINQAGVVFSGHTEYLAAKSQTKKVVMMLASSRMRVALVTTHLPLKDVAHHISYDNVKQTLAIVIASLKQWYGISAPRLLVAGLNPHAGEGGYLGREEIEIITPVINSFCSEDIIGPLPADTMFSQSNLDKADAFVAMYHDQGLSVLKYDAFGEAINITLGLPFIRTSVDHGTALTIAGTGKANEASLLLAICQAQKMGERQCQLA